MADSPKFHHLEAIRDTVRERMNKVGSLMREMSPTPMDNRERDGAEKAKLWARLNGLPESIRDNIMGQMAFRAGHKEGEDSPCEWCNYMASQTK